ncbi:MAG: nuclear transport factor 2 family protein [FCB group bacterium]|jgi:ketosteroid isomerase-like protein
MKSIFLFFLLLFSVSCSKDALVNKNIEINNIKTVLLNQQNDWNKGDIEAYMQGYWNSDSLLFIGKSGPKYGWKTTLENYKKSYPDTKAMGKLKFTFLKIELLSDINAVVIGKWELARETDKPSGYFSLIMKKISGNWKIIIDHSS